MTMNELQIICDEIAAKATDILNSNGCISSKHVVDMLAKRLKLNIDIGED